jgi:hypothetical protein
MGVGAIFSRFTVTHSSRQGQGIAPEGHPTPDTRLFRRNSGVHPIFNTRDFVGTGGNPTPETRPFARVSGGCENCGQNKAKSKKVGSFAPNKSKQGKSSHRHSMSDDSNDSYLCGFF